MNAKPQSAAAAADARHEQLSALADGDAGALAEACARWRDDPEARQRWHAYHLIGDVLRSDDLASPPGHDAAFLSALRGRLEREPVVLAPAPRRHRHWLLPGAAAAAGFVAVAGVVGVLRNGAPPAETPVAAAPAPAGNVVPVVDIPATNTLIRDPKLDRLLAMHRSAGGGFAAVPGATPRNLEVMATTPAMPVTPVVAPAPR